MKSIDLSPEWVQTIGWTLLHSLWQAPLVFALLFLFMKSAVARSAKVRYGASVVSLALIFMISMATFLLIRPNTFAAQEVKYLSSATDVTVISYSAASVVGQTWQWLDQHVIWITRVWMLGAIIFLARMVAGFYFMDRLRHRSVPVTGEWADRIQALAAKLDIQRWVQLAEAHIDAPIVIGFARPVVLFPIGLLSGLSTAQVEAILLHELSHVQRHDFLVNISQSLMEAVFFFNPFVWMVSSYIRQEREHCCDDVVLAHGTSPLVYAQTLAQLEEARLPMPLALGFSADKNLLLQRIKRIMEKSVTKNSERGRVLPIVLLLLGLACMSWLTIQQGSHEGEGNDSPDPDPVVADTVIKEKSKGNGVTVERRTITRWDKNGEPHEEVVEIIDGEGDFDSEDWDINFDIDTPDFPAAPSFPAMPDFPGFPSFPDSPDMFAFHDFSGDSLPTTYSFRLQEDEWGAFEKEFTVRFREQYKDFWEKNSAQMEKMMKEAMENARALEDERFDADLAREMALVEKQMALLPKVPDMDHFAKDMERHARDMERFEKDMERMGHDMKFLEEDLKELEKNTKAFEKELLEQLVQDGYLQKGEKMGDVHFNNDEISVNGKKIKSTDVEKYRSIQKKYFKKSDRYHRIE